MRLGKRTAQLLREAIVLAYVEGVCHGKMSEPGDPHPKDSDVVARVLAASVSMRDLYPALSKLDEAREADAERRRQSTEVLKHLLNSEEN